MNHNRLTHGQSTVEYALVAIPFFLLVMGVMDLGRAVLYSNALNNAVREGARLGIVRTPTANDICARVAGAVFIPGVQPSATCGQTPDGSLIVCVASTISAGSPPSCPPVQRGTPGSPSDPVRVTAQYSFRPITPLISAITGTTIRLTASTAMYVEE